MNTEIESSIETLVGDLPEAERNEARTILCSCHFQAASDPVFGLLRFWQLREKSVGDKERPLAAEVRQMVLEMDSRLWEARRFKLTFFIACLVLAVFLGGLLVGGTFFHMARVNPNGTMNYFGLADTRMTQMENAGVRLRVQDEPADFVIGLKGNLTKPIIQTNGEIIFIFHKQP